MTENTLSPLNSASGADAVRGPIRVSANGRHFVDAQGRPFFWLGDTAWPLLSCYTSADADAYLTSRAARGFSVIQCVVAWGQPNPEESLAGTPPGPNEDGHLPWLDRDPARPNPAFYAHVDKVLQMAQEKGLILGLLPVWGFHVNDTRILTTANAAIYGEFLGSRYRHQPNIVWINGGDREPVGFEDVYRELARGLRAGDGGAHLMTYHPCGWHSSAYYFHNEDWLDFNMIETWTAWHKVYQAVSADYAMLPAKPVVLGEGAYEDGPEYPEGPITPLVLRRQAWWSFMAGGFYTNGQNQMWRMEPWWQKAFETPGADHMRHYRAIIESRPWWQMIPDQGLINYGMGTEQTLNAAMRTLDRSCAMLYFASRCHIQVNLDRLATREVRATWVNPQNGETHEAGVYATGKHIADSIFPQWKAQWFSTPPYWEDAVLILDGVG